MLHAWRVAEHGRLLAASGPAGRDHHAGPLFGGHRRPPSLSVLPIFTCGRPCLQVAGGAGGLRRDRTISAARNSARVAYIYVRSGTTWHRLLGLNDMNNA